MFDFSVTKEHLSFGYPIFSLFLYIFIYSYFKRRNYLQYNNYRKNNLLWFYMFIFSIAAFYDGDFYHYMDIVQNFSFDNLSHLEIIYTPIIYFVERNYLLFRIIVWGGALLLTTYIFKRLKYETLYVYLYVFFILYIIRFAYVRAALSFAIFYCGLSYLIKQSNYKYLSYLLGIVLIYLSTFFHNSAIILVAMTILLFVPLNRKLLISFVLLLPVMYILFKDFFFYLLSRDDLGTDGVVSNKLVRYTEGDMEKKGSGEILMLLGEIITFYGIYIYILIDYLKKNYQDKVLICCYKIVFGILFVAFFLFMLGTGSSYLFPRIMEMAYIPMAIIVGRSYELGYMKQRALRKILYVGFVVTVIRLSYSVYLTVL